MSVPGDKQKPAASTVVGGGLGISTYKMCGRGAHSGDPKRAPQWRTSRSAGLLGLEDVGHPREQPDPGADDVQAHLAGLDDAVGVGRVAVEVPVGVGDSQGATVLGVDAHAALGGAVGTTDGARGPVVVVVLGEPDLADLGARAQEDHDHQDHRDDLGGLVADEVAQEVHAPALDGEDPGGGQTQQPKCGEHKEQEAHCISDL